MRVRRERAQSLVEYGLIIFFIAVAAVAGLTVYGSSVGQLWGTILSQVVPAV